MCANGDVHILSSPSRDRHKGGYTSSMQRQDNAGLLRIIGRLRSCLGADQIVADRDRLQALSRDFLRRSRGIHVDTTPAELPIFAVSPRCTDDVVATVRAAASEDIPIVEFGGGTGLMGGARTVRPGIVIDMRTLNRVLAISPRDRTVSVEAGAVLADVGDALAPHGLVIGHDPWTYPIATVGGAISTNGLGYLGAHYGSMGDQVLGLTVVTADGDVVRTRPMPRSSTGPRLMHLFIGAEGTLGIITEAVLRVFPRPEATLLMAFNFVDFEAGFRASEDLFAAGITPAMLDFGQTYAGIRLTDRPVTPTGALGLMNLAFQGLAEEAGAVSRRAAKLLEAAGGRRLPLKAARGFWNDRHVVAEEIRARQHRSGTDPEDWLPEGVQFDFLHIALPASAVIPFKRESEPLLLAQGISIGEWGLWNQPELFSMTLFRRSTSDADAETFAGGVDEVLRLAQDAGGSMEYCHGAGIRLAHLMGSEHGDSMEVLRAIKRSLDPHGRLNPGKLGL